MTDPSLEGFSAEAHQYCEGISDPKAKAYAIGYLCYLQACAKGVPAEQPKNRGLRSPVVTLIRSKLSQIYSGYLGARPPRAA